MQIVVHEDAESKVTKKILSFEPHKISEETYLAYASAVTLFASSAGTSGKK